MLFTATLATLALTSLSMAQFFSNVAEAQLEATQFSMTYGFPLSIFTPYVQPLLESVGCNKFVSQRTPNSVSNKDGTLYPDADFLTSPLVVDLSSDVLELTVPSVPDGQYFVFGFYDIWGDNFANVGSVSGTPAGKYLLESGLDSGQPTGYKTSNYTTDHTYHGYVTFPGRYGLVLQRFELPSENGDLSPLHTLQDKSTVKAIPGRDSSAAPAPALTYHFLNSSSSPATTLDAEITERLDLTAKVAQFNPPEKVSDQEDITRILELAGISNGKYSQPSAVNLTIAAFGLRAGQQTEDSTAVKNNGWTQSKRAVQGNFHGNYVERATLDFAGWLQNVPAEALYPVPENGTKIETGAAPTLLGVGGLPIGADQSIMLTFSDGKPPVDAFWSVTAYDETAQLIENSLDRVNIGSRDSITYPDGTLVYGSEDKKGPFQVLIQPANVTPPSNWTSNWLPSPAGASNTTLYLRFYAPGQELLDNSYTFPTLTTQAAIKG